MSNLSPKHCEALKWLLRYLKNIFNEGLNYKSANNGVKLKGFMDVDDSGNRDNRKSTSFYMFTFCDSCMS